MTLRFQVNFTDGNTLGRFGSLELAIAEANQYRSRVMVWDLEASYIVYRNWK